MTRIPEELLFKGNLTVYFIHSIFSEPILLASFMSDVWPRHDKTKELLLYYMITELKHVELYLQKQK